MKQQQRGYMGRPATRASMRAPNRRLLSSSFILLNRVSPPVLGGGMVHFIFVHSSLKYILLLVIWSSSNRVVELQSLDGWRCSSLPVGGRSHNHLLRCSQMSSSQASSLWEVTLGRCSPRGGSQRNSKNSSPKLYVLWDFGLGGWSGSRGLGSAADPALSVRGMSGGTQSLSADTLSLSSPFFLSCSMTSQRRR